MGSGGEGSRSVDVPIFPYLPSPSPSPRWLSGKPIDGAALDGLSGAAGGEEGKMASFDRVVNERAANGSGGFHP